MDRSPALPVCAPPVIGILLVALLLGLGQGCASPVRGPVAGYHYFGSSEPHDAWAAKIIGWQRRERADQGPVLGGAPPPVGEGEPAPSLDRPTPVREAALRAKYFDFRDARRRQVARELAAWIQSEARHHYVADGPIDHWATLEETLRGNGDDCDGLELLVFHALRDLGFAESEVYRAIVYRADDGQHHMVTLWFEDRDDPWVIDPTGAMSSGMRRMSEIPGWVPLKVFNESAEFTVRPVERLAEETLASSR